MKRSLLLAVLGFGILCAACSSSSVQGVADLILLNGTVYTVDPALPWAEAVAVKEDRILAVGSSEEILALAGVETEVVDLAGSLLLPGFIDAHTHFLNGGFSLADIQLRDAQSREEFISRIRAYVDQA
jgi:predicted amidohydrolase YtcJ